MTCGRASSAQSAACTSAAYAASTIARVRLRGVEYDWRCGTDQEIESRGYRQDDRGFWVHVVDASMHLLHSVSEARRGAA